VTWPSILPPGWTVEWDPTSAEEEHEEWWDRLPHLSVYFSVSSIPLHYEQWSLLLLNSDDVVINFVLLNVWFYVLLYFLCASPSSEYVVLDPVCGLVGLCDGTSQVIRPTYSCPCPTDLRQPCRCPWTTCQVRYLLSYLSRNVSPVLQTLQIIRDKEMRKWLHNLHLFRK
jgi:hypothetical protein